VVDFSNSLEVMRSGERHDDNSGIDRLEWIRIGIGCCSSHTQSFSPSCIIKTNASIHLLLKDADTAPLNITFAANSQVKLWLRKVIPACWVLYPKILHTIMITGV